MADGISRFYRHFLHTLYNFWLSNLVLPDSNYEWVEHEKVTRFMDLWDQFVDAFRFIVSYKSRYLHRELFRALLWQVSFQSQLKSKIVLRIFLKFRPLFPHAHRTLLSEWSWLHRCCSVRPISFISSLQFTVFSCISGRSRNTRRNVNSALSNDWPLPGPLLRPGVAQFSHNITKQYHVCSYRTSLHSIWRSCNNFPLLLISNSIAASKSKTETITQIA